MSWKQPLSVDLEKDFGEDTECFILMVLLIIKAANSEGVMNSGNTVHTIRRGEVVFGRKAWAKYFGGSEFKAKRTLERLQNMHNKVHIKITNKYTLVELLNYDSLVSLAQDNAQQTNNKLTTDAQQTHTSLYDKSVKSDKSEDTEPVVEEYQEYFDLWKSIIGTSIRNHRWENKQAIKKLSADFSLEELTQLLQAIRMFRADKYQTRKIQSALTSYRGLLTYIEQLESYMQSVADKRSYQSNTIVI